MGRAEALSSIFFLAAMMSYAKCSDRNKTRKLNKYIKITRLGLKKKTSAYLDTFLESKTQKLIFSSTDFTRAPQNAGAL